MSRPTNTLIPLSTGYNMVVRYDPGVRTENYETFPGVEIFVEGDVQERRFQPLGLSEPDVDAIPRHPTRPEWEEAREKVLAALDQIYRGEQQ